MSDLDSRIKWKATGVHGHTWETLDGYLYTSEMPPVEAEEFDRVFQRAQELESALAAAHAQVERGTARLAAQALDAERARQRVAELERQLAQAARNNADLAKRNDELRAKLDAVPDYVDYCYAALNRDEMPMTIDGWAKAVQL